MDNCKTVQVCSDSDLSMDDFQTENRDGDYDFILIYFSGEEEEEGEEEEKEEEEEAEEEEEEEEEEAEAEEEKEKVVGEAKPHILVRPPCCFRKGTIALEIFSVKVNRPGSLSGRIYVDNGCMYDPVIYNNKRNDDNKELQYNVKEEGGDLLLTGPDAIIETLDTTFVFVDLVHKMINSSSEVEEHSITELKGIAYDSFWMYMEDTVDKPLINRLVSDDGKLIATMYSTLFNDAAEAIVEVKLLDESRSCGVYGSIKASNNMFSGPNFRSILFLKDRNDRLLVERGQPIQLSRSIVTVSCWHNLIICVNLTSEDAYLPSARITFPVKCSGESVKKINSQIQVKCLYHKISLLDLYCEALDPDLYDSRGSDLHLDLENNFRMPSYNQSVVGQHPNLHMGGFICQAIRKVRDLLPVALCQLLESLEKLCEGVKEIHEKVKELQSLSKFYCNKNLKRELTDISRRHTTRNNINIEKDVKALNEKAVALIGSMARDYMQPIEHVMFHEIVCFKKVDKLQSPPSL